MQSLPGFPIPMPNESIAGRMLTDKRWKSLRPAGMKRSGISVQCSALFGTLVELCPAFLLFADLQDAIENCKARETWNGLDDVETNHQVNDECDY